MVMSYNILKFYDKKPLALIQTFGCKQNESDSEKISGLLEEMGFGFTDDSKTADIILFNTCAIRENAEKKVFGLLGSVKKLKQSNPGLIIGISGCMAEEDHVVSRIKSTYTQVDIVFGTHNIHKLPQLLYEAISEKKRVFAVGGDDGCVHEGIPTRRGNGISAGVPIMYGCNNFCSYCIVPYVRGRERSRNEEDIVREVEGLVSRGYKEVMLLGQNVNSYKNGGEAFANLLKAVSDTGIDRIRFMTSHPKDLNDSVIEAIASRKNICKSLHLPVQAGSNKVLKLMNRKYTRESYLETIKKVRQRMPDIVLTTDIIVGFPGETNEDFEETLSLLSEVRFDMIFSFIYSKRRGTAAEKFEDVLTEDEKKENFNRLLDLQNSISLEKNMKMVGKVEAVLVEGRSKTNADYLTGRTDGGKIVNFLGDPSLTGSIVDIKITEAKTWHLTGEPVN